MISLEEFHKRNVELSEELLRDECLSPQVTVMTKKDQTVIVLWEFVKDRVKRPLFLIDYAISRVEDWELANFMCAMSIGPEMKDYRRGAIQRYPGRRRVVWVWTVSREGRKLATSKRIVGEGRDMVLEDLEDGNGLDL